MGVATYKNTLAPIDQPASKMIPVGLPETRHFVWLALSSSMAADVNTYSYIP